MVTAQFVTSRPFVLRGGGLAEVYELLTKVLKRRKE